MLYIVTADSIYGHGKRKLGLPNSPLRNTILALGHKHWSVVLDLLAFGPVRKL